MEYIHHLQAIPVPDETNIYQVEKNGQYQYLKICLVSDVTSQLGIIMDVTDDITKKQLMRYEHDHDYLTGLPIYQYFEKTVEHLLSDSSEKGYSAGIMMDLDKFKTINDTYGHDFGDTYLRHMAKKMLELPSEHCFPSRRSGDEFCLFLHGYSSREELLSQVHAFWQSVKDSPVRLPDQTFRELVVSGGLAWADEHTNMAKLMYCADVALYTAKKQFPGTLQIFDPDAAAGFGQNIP